MSRLTQDAIRRIIEQVDIVDLISKYVSLKIKGAEATGLCPFHNEKSPSFTVSRNKQFYYCFGCHAKGNAIDFIIQQQKLTFPESIEQLSELYSIPIEYEQQHQSNTPSLDYKALYQLIDAASTHYQNDLKSSKEAINYCKSRHITGITAKKFSLGYASASNALSSISQQHDQALRQASGLWNSETNRERMRHRLIFPITNPQGKTIGFGGRALSDEQQPKYLNSPDTPLFHKSKVLYGMHQALKHPINHWIIVEGYMDVLLCHQCGATEAVAALGTAFTLEHFKLLTRYSNKITFCFDADGAGLRALHRSMKSLLPIVTDKHDIRCVYLPDGQDPDQYILTHGIQQWNKLIDTSQTWEEYWQREWSTGLQLDKLSDKAKYLQRAQESFDDMPNSYLKQLWLANIQRQTDAKITLKPLETIKESPILSQAPMSDILRWIIEEPEYKNRFIQEFQQFPIHHEPIAHITAWIECTSASHGIAAWIESARDTPLAAILNKAQTPSDGPVIPFIDCIKWLKKHALDSNIEALIKLDQRNDEENKLLKYLLELKHKPSNITDEL